MVRSKLFLPLGMFPNGTKETASPDTEKVREQIEAKHLSAQ